MYHYQEKSINHIFSIFFNIPFDFCIIAGVGFSAATVDVVLVKVVETFVDKDGRTSPFQC